MSIIRAISGRREVLYMALFLLLVGLGKAAWAETPSAVSLVYFRGQSLDNAAALEWRTATETETAGFKITRADNAAGPFEFLPGIGIIPARGSVSSGALYEATDNTAENGETFWYTLVEIEFDNSENDLATIQLLISPTPTPDPIGGGTNTPVPTSTIPPTSTPQPTATTSSPTLTPTSTNPSTPTPSRSATERPTMTPQPTDTPPPTSLSQPTATSPSQPTATAATKTPTVAISSPTPTRDDGDDVVEAAGPTAVAQVDEPYPGPPEVEEAEDSRPSPDTTLQESPVPGEAYPAGDGDQTVVASDDASTIGDRASRPAPARSEDQNDESQSGNGGRILLWIGFIAALLIFAGGVVISILLSTRRRLPEED